MTQWGWIRCGQKQYAGAMGGGGKQEEGRLEVTLLPDTVAGMSVAPGDASASALLASYTVAQFEGCEPTQPPAPPQWDHRTLTSAAFVWRSPPTFPSAGIIS